MAHDAVLVAHRVRAEVQRGRLRDGGRVERACAAGDAALGEDGRHDGQVVLVLVEMGVGRVARLVERVQ